MRRSGWPGRAPGVAPVRFELERVFWRQIAAGLSTEDAAAVIGVSVPTGHRLFRDRGGMPTFMLLPVKGRYLSFAEREQVALAKAAGDGVREIARQLGRDPGTISRELRRNASLRNGKPVYVPSSAHWKAEMRARRPKPAKLAVNPRLRRYVQERLSGQVRRADGTPVPGPATAPVLRRRPERGRDRRWATAWSPEQISRRLRVDFPDDESMRISPEAIYQAVFVQSRGALNRELVACLRTGRSLRSPRARARQHPGNHVTPDVEISQRPADAEDRAVPGHWEGDLIIGAGKTAIGTLVERTTRFTMLLHLPRDGDAPSRSTLSGYGAAAVRAAIAAQITTLPEELRRSLTWDRGKELAQHAQFTIDTGVRVYFADPHSPWQRGTNENTNGLLRQYFPKGTDLTRWTRDDIEAVAATLNARPRKTLDWRTPAEALDQLLSSPPAAGVATTG
ncbi:IS30 family transposase [Kineosporia sp. A_224]|uniref:IS30 family transposase n=1 Tax=Kineosporia sp. A_224 TaxID=1962180 RepID=UPI000B4B2154|nr:IS30 family transposase [Kineosporia sp. A_224]